MRVRTQKLSPEEVFEIGPDLIISHGYRHIIQKPVIERYHHKIINLHISFLPWNRGVSPNLWSFVTATKKGVSIHLIDEGIDTGDILFQEEITFEEEVTLSDSYEVLKNTIENLFISNWSRIEDDECVPIKQDLTAGSYHSMKETDQILQHLGDKPWTTKTGDLPALLRTTPRTNTPKRRE